MREAAPKLPWVRDLIVYNRLCSPLRSLSSLAMRHLFDSPLDQLARLFDPRDHSSTALLVSPPSSFFGTSAGHTSLSAFRTLDEKRFLSFVVDIPLLCATLCSIRSASDI